MTFFMQSYQDCDTIFFEKHGNYRQKTYYSQKDKVSYAESFMIWKSWA